MIAMLTFAGCSGQVVSDADAICSIPRPTFTQEEAESLSDRTLREQAAYWGKLTRACEGL